MIGNNLGEEMTTTTNEEKARQIHYICTNCRPMLLIWRQTKPNAEELAEIEQIEYMMLEIGKLSSDETIKILARSNSIALLLNRLILETENQKLKKILTQVSQKMRLGGK